MQQTVCAGLLNTMTSSTKSRRQYGKWIGVYTTMFADPDNTNGGWQNDHHRRHPNVSLHASWLVGWTGVNVHRLGVNHESPGGGLNFLRGTGVAHGLAAFPRDIRAGDPIKEHSELARAAISAAASSSFLTRIALSRSKW